MILRWGRRLNRRDHREAAKNLRLASAKKTGDGMEAGIAAGAPSLVERDAPCRKCSYNLRSLPIAGRGTVPLPIHAAIIAFDAATALAFAIGLGVQLSYLEKLAARLPDPHLSARARAIKYTFPICYLLVAGWQKFLALSPGALGAPPSGFTMIFGCTGFIGSLGSLICLINYMRLIGNLGDRLSKEQKVSELIWDPDILPSILPK
jgi:hypothetical protein